MILRTKDQIKARGKEKLRMTAEPPKIVNQRPGYAEQHTQSSLVACERETIASMQPTLATGGGLQRSLQLVVDFEIPAESVKRYCETPQLVKNRFAN